MCEFYETVVFAKMTQWVLCLLRCAQCIVHVYVYVTEKLNKIFNMCIVSYYFLFCILFYLKYVGFDPLVDFYHPQNES